VFKLFQNQDCGLENDVIGRTTSHSKAELENIPHLQAVVVVLFNRGLIIWHCQAGWT